MQRLIYILLLSLFFLLSCTQKKDEQEQIDLIQIQARDTLVVGSMYGSSSYFIFKGEVMGFDYELCKRFADSQGLELQVLLANSLTELIDMLEGKQIDMIAYRLNITNELKNKFIFSKNEYINNQVLIQRSSRTELSNVLGLIGQEVHVNKASKYEERLINLNEELGGGIDIKTVNDSVNLDELIEMVSTGEIDYTVAEKDVALLNKTYFRNLDCKIPVSFKQRSAWAVRKTSPLLANEFNKWYSENVERDYYKYLYNKYFVQAKYFGDRKINIPKGAISPYDALFKKYAQTLGWDWHLLAALSYEESRFDSSVVSWVGARGLMQMMPNTAEEFGLSIEDISKPELNLRAATKYLKHLTTIFRTIDDKSERLKFVIAAYNSGPGHILDARALAEKYGKNRNVWYANVESFLLLKSHKEYYTDPVVKSGYCRSGETVRYVINVLKTYERYRNRK